MSDLRRSRVESAILREISIYMHSLDDPILNSITITHVEVTKDLHFAKIYYTLIGKEAEQDDAKLRLSKALGRIQRDLAYRLKDMRKVPVIAFQFDLSLQEGNQVLSILDSIEKELKEKGE
ncbi:MAG: 30S ribosome-binding factor RbfA [Caldisericaceae bacterium]